MKKKILFRWHYYLMYFLNPILILCFLSLFTQVKAELLFFPNLKMEFKDGLRDTPGVAKESYEFGFNAFYTKDFNDLRILVEFFAADSEREVERLQLGWLINPVTTIWFGRYHTPVSYWNSEYHHGTYLQPTITRPTISEFEDDGGILPVHATGVLFKSSRQISSGNIDYAISLGLGPEIEGDEMEAFDIVRPNNTKHRGTYWLNVAFQPNQYRALSGGIYLGLSQIPDASQNISDVDQLVVGAFAEYSMNDFRILSAINYIKNEFTDSVAKRQGEIVNAYLQVNYDFAEKWSVYSRLDKVKGYKNDPYLAIIGGIEDEKNTLGLRYDFYKNQAISFEIANVHANGDYHLHSIFQWSAVFPE